MLSITLTALALSAPVQDLPSLPLADHFEVERYDVQDLVLPASRPAEFSVSIRLDGALHRLELSPYSLRAEDFRLVVQDESGFHDVPAPAPATYRGRLAGDAGSDVRVSWIDGRLNGTVTDGFGQRWGIQPAAAADPTLPRSAHVVYSELDVRAHAGTCGLVDDGPGGAPAPSTEGSGLKIAQIAFDADVEFYAINGQSVVNTTNDIENVLNAMESIYEDDVQVTFELTAIVVRTAEPDPYSQVVPGNLLNQFTSEWAVNQGGFKRDLTHLMTGKNLQGSVIGVANLGALCMGGYGLSQSRFSNNFTSRVGLTAHEVGHTMGSPHCDATQSCFIMCSGLGGCSNNVTLFGPFAQNQITTGVAASPCVKDLPAPLAPPFLDDFESGGFDPSRWIHVDSTTIEFSPLLEPSGVASAVLDAQSAQPAKQADIRTNEILLGDGSAWILSYYVNDNGVDAGEELVVYYSDATESWVELDRVTSDGVVDTNFELRSVPLPPAALHDGARVRFHSQVDQFNDNWHVDDVRIDTTTPCPVPKVHCTGKLNSQGCVPTISFAGQSSATGATSFSIEAAGVVTQKPGLMFYGYATAAIAFQDAFLCVQPPTRRTAIQASGGNFEIDCDGTFAYDFNALIQSGADPALVEGQTVSAQYWYRDPGVATQTGLTGGLSFDICP